MYFIVLSLLAPAATVFCDCYWNDKTAYGYFGGITPYDDVRGDIRDIAPLSGCEPINIWFMMRHGTRHPGHDDMEQMKNAMSIKEDILRNHAGGRGHLCAQDITDLQKWHWNDLMTSSASVLTEEGYQELLAIGTRFHEKFYKLLENLENYHFRPSLEQRTEMSAIAFAEGLGLGKWSFKVSQAMKIDDVVRPYKHCNRRIEYVINSPHMHNELNKYYETEEFKQMLINVRERMGIDDELTPKNVTGLYNLCRFYRAYTKTKRDPWCALFSNEELKIMEYVDDIHHYYRRGYGGESVNVELGELALKDLFEKFQSGNNTKSITGYFTHDTMIEMIYSALGLYNDYPGLSGFQRLKNRQWRTSYIAPFAANFVAILNRCKTTEDTHESIKIQFLINEVEIPLCKERTCSWNEFKRKFASFTDRNIDLCKSTNNITNENFNMS